MVFHLIAEEAQLEAHEILPPAFTDWVADMKAQTITHVETGCKSYAYPIQREGIVVPFAAHQITVRFVEMADRQRVPSDEVITRLRHAGHSLDSFVYDGE